MIDTTLSRTPFSKLIDNLAEALFETLSEDASDVNLARITKCVSDLEPRGCGASIRKLITAMDQARRYREGL